MDLAAFWRGIYNAGYTNLFGVDIIAPDVGIVANVASCDLGKDALPLETSSVDLVVMIEVVEHLPNQGHVLSEIRRVLSPAGIGVITTLNLHSIEARGKFFATGDLRQFDERGDPTHIAPIFLKPFSTLLRWHGLSLSDARVICNNKTTTSLLPRAFARLVRLLPRTREIKGNSLLMIIQRLKGIRISA